MKKIEIIFRKQKWTLKEYFDVRDNVFINEVEKLVKENKISLDDQVIFKVEETVDKFVKLLDIIIVDN